MLHMHRPGPTLARRLGAQIVGPPFADHTTIAVAAVLADVIGGYQPPPLIRNGGRRSG